MTTAAHTVTSRITHDRLTVPALRELIDTHGYAYVKDIPDGFDHAGFLAGVGPLMPQYDGKLIWSIQADERYADLYHSLNTKALHPHTECYEFTGRPPKYLALWCLVPGEDDGGHTTLADMYRFLDSLTAQERERLATIRYVFCSSSGVKDMKLDRVAEHPFVEQREGRPPIVRFSVNNVDPAGDTLLPSVLKRAVTYFDEEHVSVGYERNALLIWDNHRMTHSRTSYTDKRRHLRRVWLDEQ